MNALVVIQARMNSSRLPGKVLEQIGPLTAIEHVYRRASMWANNVVVAMPDTERDEQLMRFCQSHQMNHYVYHGEESDVLGRFWGLVEQLKPNYIVRLTADCPFLEPNMIPIVLGRLVMTEADVATNVGDPRTLPDGYDVEAFTSSALHTAHINAVDPADREHVTPWMHRNLTRTVLKGGSAEYGSLRWTLDTPEDLQFMRAVAERIDVTPPHPYAFEIMKLIDAEPALARYNDVSV